MIRYNTPPTCKKKHTASLQNNPLNLMRFLLSSVQSSISFKHFNLINNLLQIVTSMDTHMTDQPTDIFEFHDYWNNEINQINLERRQRNLKEETPNSKDTYFQPARKRNQLPVPQEHAGYTYLSTQEGKPRMTTQEEKSFMLEKVHIGETDLKKSKEWAGNQAKDDRSFSKVIVIKSAFKQHQPQ
uniref:MatS protein n=1 Tax=Acytostelium subglobosum TaxID=361139 RepID=D8MIT9_ACYSU|nr:MatS protein [Acytostelium subglobosum]